MIKRTSMDHKWFYQYRLHTQKSLELSEDFPELHNYLETVFEKRPDEYFKQGISGSKLNFNLKLKIYQLNVHEICELTKEALKQDMKKTGHTKVELFFLERDDKTIASEIPIWIHPEELKNKEIDGILTGHIDILRIENNKIWVWDYKPNAKQEKYASTQLYFYAQMLSKRTGIPIDKFRCGYFDENDAFIFEPKLEEVL
ncbi:MAG: PD-(D/E)XK nuclease family protein [Candidatus Nanoarchaeia archaeon]|nr:PD-(D/E)XK nuclease family protein [Candidatus Nanoarchaeia archaeon]